MLPLETNAKAFRGGLASTHWSTIHACLGTGKSAQAAREELCRDYWYPVYTYIRRSEPQGFDAEDLTQDFFAHILPKLWLEHADKSKGRFRSYLLISLQNFLRDQRDIRRALKREGSYRHIPLDLHEARSRYAEARTLPITSDDSFDYEWAVAVVNASLQRLESEYISAGKVSEYSALKALLTTQGNASIYEGIAQRLDTSANGVKVAVHRLRRMYGTILREEVSRTVSSRAEVVEEMRYIRQVFANKITVAV